MAMSKSINQPRLVSHNNALHFLLFCFHGKREKCRLFKSTIDELKPKVRSAVSRSAATEMTMVAVSSSSPITTGTSSAVVKEERPK